MGCPGMSLRGPVSGALAVAGPAFPRALAMARPAGALTLPRAALPLARPTMPLALTRPTLPLTLARSALTVALPRRALTVRVPLCMLPLSLTRRPMDGRPPGGVAVRPGTMQALENVRRVAVDVVLLGVLDQRIPGLPFELRDRRQRIGRRAARVLSDARHHRKGV